MNMAWLLDKVDYGDENVHDYFDFELPDEFLTYLFVA